MNKAAYFECVVVALYLDNSQIFGPISRELADRETNKFFHCGHCSTEQHRVYHNILGNHWHVSETELLKLIDDAPFDGPDQNTEAA